MADGVRIIATDERLRGATIEVPHPTRLITRDGHQVAKVYSIRLDGEGAALVSTVVWDRIQEIMAIDPTAPRFLEVGLAAAPPTQVINGQREARPVYLHRTGHGFDSRGVVLVPRLQLK